MLIPILVNLYDRMSYFEKSIGNDTIEKDVSDRVLLDLCSTSTLCVRSTQFFIFLLTSPYLYLKEDSNRTGNRIERNNPAEFEDA